MKMVYILKAQEAQRVAMRYLLNTAELGHSDDRHLTHTSHITQIQTYKQREHTHKHNSTHTHTHRTTSNCNNLFHCIV